MQTSRFILVAAILLASELFLGIGLIGIVGGLVGALVAAQRLTNSAGKIRIATLFLCVAFATCGWLSLNIRTAKQHAVPIIAACERFQSAHDRFPSDLRELTPKLLSTVPRAGYTLIARRFAYDSDRPELCFAAMFHGVFCYDFQTKGWTTND